MSPARTSRHFGIWGKKLPRKAKTLKSGLMPTVLQNMHVPLACDLGLSDPIDIQIRDLECIGSYSWVKDSSLTPTIVVPGIPRKWIGSTLPVKLEADKYATFTDQNTHLVPSAPLLPLFLASDALAMSAAPRTRIIDWPSIDFVTDRTNLRMLLRWTRASTTRRQWRIDMELVGDKTVLLNRWDRRTAVTSIKNKSFGHTFEFTVTESGTNGVPSGFEGALEGHHRIVKYGFGGFNMVVRFEVDGYISLHPPPTADVKRVRRSSSRAKLKHLPAYIPRSSSEYHGVTPQSLVKVVHAGIVIPQSSLLEIKSSRLGKVCSMKSKSYAQLFFSQTPHLHIGGHVSGEFRRILECSVAEGELEAQHERLMKSGALQRLVVALRRIQEIARKEGKGRRLALVFEGKILRVYEKDVKGGGSSLPEEIVARFKVGTEGSDFR